MLARKNSMAQTLAPLRLWILRSTFPIFMGMSVILMGFHISYPKAFDSLRVYIVDGITPVFQVLSSPITATHKVIRWAGDIVHTYADNQSLRLRILALEQDHQRMASLETENAQLRAMLSIPTEGAVHRMAARVIAIPHDSFSKSVAVAAGSNQDVRKDQIVATHEGLVGRVIAVGRRSARVLLLTDLNSRVPVFVGPQRHPAILGGDNSSQPQLFHLSPHAVVQEGDSVVTSGQGGIFPAHMSVGFVSSVEKKGIQVALSADVLRSEFVTLLRYEAPPLDVNDPLQ